MTQIGPRLGIDLGGTKIEAVVLRADGVAIWRERSATPAGNYEATIASIASMVANAQRQVGATVSVGIGMPGTISLRTGLVKNANSTVLNGKPLKHDIERALNCAVRLQNDANCFAYSEAIDGAGRDALTVFGVILGTGVGAGVVINRELLVGVNSIAGEWGHNPLPPASQLGFIDDRVRERLSLESPGPACYCGRYGCVESWLSGTGFAADYRRLAAQVDAATSLPVDSSSRQADAADIIARMRSGDVIAIKAFDAYVDRLARALAGVINIVDPQVIVLGGGMSKVDELYQRLPMALPRYVFSDDLRTRILPPVHGDASGVRGAAWLWN